jgi:hypothetical protein
MHRSQVGAVIVLALTVVGIEAASMIPYLAAIGFLTASELSLAGRDVVLFVDCLMMIAPALLSRNANEAMAWVMFLVGLYMVGDSLNALGWHRSNVSSRA